MDYDLDGNMVKSKLAGKDMVLSYDSQNKLVKAGADSYTYDVENNRIASTQAGKTTSYVYDTIGSMTQMLSSQDSTGTMTKYVYGLGLLYEESKNAIAVYHYDLRGCTVALTDEQGTVTDRYHYDTYGQVSHTSGENDTSFLYNGRDGVVTDQNGLLYMRARYYSPELLRFINADVVKGSIADGDTLNRYAFVLGNPVSFVDPFGLSADLAANRYVEGKYSYSSVYEEITEFISSIDPEEVHLVLDVTGFVEFYGIGTVSDAVNTIWYITEGNWGDAVLSGISLIPVQGDVVAKAGKYAGKYAEKYAPELVKNLGKWSDDFVEGASKLSKRAGRELGKTKFGSRVTEEAVKAKRRVCGWFDNISGYFSREGKNAIKEEKVAKTASDGAGSGSGGSSKGPKKSGSNTLWKPNTNKNDLWNKGKLKTHYEKHGIPEFGAKSSKEYSEMAYEFGTRKSDGIIEVEEGAYVYRYEPSTNNVFVGTLKGGKIKSFYKWDGRADDAVIETLKRLGKL